MNSKNSICLILILILFSCTYNTSIDDRYQAPVFTGEIIGYLQLDSTMLEISKIADNINIPWDIEMTNGDWLWYTEQQGTINRLNLATGEKELMLKVPDVYHKKSYGLLGMGLHPDFENKPYLFIHYTTRTLGEELKENINSKLVRYLYQNNELSEPLILMDSIPGNTYHNGSRILVTEDNYIYLSLGDAGRQNYTQDVEKPEGKILRITIDGKVPEDNPIPGNPVWSWGHRNPQGLCISSKRLIYSSEHGPNNDDEINLIQKGANYGWPNVQGFCNEENEISYCRDSTIIEPLISWTPTLAVAGIDFYSDSVIPEWNNSLVVANMKGRALRVLGLKSNGLEVNSEKIYFQRIFGRIRDVEIDLNGIVYFSTTNRDWHPRYQPWMYDSLPDGGDRIIRLRAIDNNKDKPVDPTIPVYYEDPEPIDLLSENWSFNVDPSTLPTGEKLYLENCATCHGPDGKGSEDLTPPLASTEWVTGDKGRLIRTVLNGLTEPIEVNGNHYNQEMPGFARLSDNDIAHLLTYIRSNFGNSANAVIAGEVYEERK